VPDDSKTNLLNAISQVIKHLFFVVQDLGVEVEINGKFEKGHNLDQYLAEILYKSSPSDLP